MKSKRFDIGDRVSWKSNLPWPQLGTIVKSLIHGGELRYIVKWDNPHIHEPLIHAADKLELATEEAEPDICIILEG